MGLGCSHTGLRSGRCAEPHAPTQSFHSTWQRWGHFPLPLQNKNNNLKKAVCECSAQTFFQEGKRRCGIDFFQCAGGSGMFSALIKREQMLHNCSRKSRMLLYVSDFPQHFGKDHWPKQTWKRDSGIWTVSASWIFKTWSTVWQKYYCRGFCLLGFYIHPWLLCECWQA